MNKKTMAVILALAVLLAGLFMYMTKAEAATGESVQKYYAYKVAFYTTNFTVYQYLKERGFRVIYKNNEETPASKQPQPAPQPKPQPKPKPQPAPASGLTADEQQMVSLVNQERAEAGLKQLTVDMRLVKSARVKSSDLVNSNYFAHTSPKGTTPWDLIHAQGVSYSRAGENLAGAASVDRAHTSLMNSQGHRANILNPNFTHIGIGIVDGGPYGKMFTQHFAQIKN
ncbi:uncharacterized protein, YkwD family [Desulfotomaculum arcticum]|uniref:Uncharacterized protein, YkwD family n=1 Tax=Desulfotruncus arcticus DSM 17038 TaxID=1121424 RepID=A0A1I2YB20_9FIRM|nr:CAP domain-containing protein [Desulfotruncus arcticus]SFH22815.1 uncharacterized protein, YkwD family [Desulfotomaculum arcticum] [Desulfotruncus arcticus DSM 17038]